MTEIEKIQKYIDRTKIQDPLKYNLRASEWIAIVNTNDILDAVSLAFNFGRAKGYRAAKKEMSAWTN